jgi:hypothetical protein
MKIAVNPAVTSRADGSRPSSSRFRALNTSANLPSDPALRSGPADMVMGRASSGGDAHRYLHERANPPHGR